MPQRSQDSNNKLSGEEKAKKMMQKMGWRGSGLGAHEQGRTTALIAQKTDKLSGKIVSSQYQLAPGEELERPVLNEQEGRQEKERPLEYNRDPTSVILLRNMVEREEADDEFREEVGIECHRYGRVESLFLHCAGSDVRVFV